MGEARGIHVLLRNQGTQETCKFTSLSVADLCINSQLIHWGFCYHKCLNLLCPGRWARNATHTGEILLNGRKQQMSYGTAVNPALFSYNYQLNCQIFKKIEMVIDIATSLWKLGSVTGTELELDVQAYVTQDDILIGTLTVRETIQYSAQLQLPRSMSRAEKLAVAEQTIAEMGLRMCSDTKVGNWHLKGLSGGERRRLSIAVEILTRPRLMYLDEPTSGLDRLSKLNSWNLCIWLYNLIVTGTGFNCSSDMCI